MASSTRSAMRPARDRRALGLLAIAGVLGAVAVAALLLGDTGPSTPQTAFASAPQGHYLVLSRPTEDPMVDVISVAPATDPGAAMPIASVSHIEGYAPTAAVSPDGTRLAVVIADAGRPSLPGASLLLVDLLTGEVTRLAIAVDHLQTPAWARDGSGIALTRTVPGESSRSDVSILFVPLDLSGETVVETHPQVLGAWVIGYDPQGELLSVVISGAGSSVFRGGVELLSLGASITRDWSLSPDGTALAYVETSATEGYVPRVVALDAAGAATAQSAGVGQALGAAWTPDSAAVFGVEPVTGGVSAQSATAGGFDIPQGYAADGSALVQHWSGTSFADPGEATLQVVTPDGRLDVPGGPAQFLGWTSR